MHVTLRANYLWVVIIAERAQEESGSNTIIGTKAGAYGLSTQSASYTGYSDDPLNNVMVGATYSEAPNGGQTYNRNVCWCRGSNSYDCVVIEKYQYIANTSNVSTPQID